MTPTPPSGIETWVMIGHKQLHSDVWRCRMCFMELGSSYNTYEGLVEHLTASKREGGHEYEGLVLDDGCVFTKCS